MNYIYGLVEHGSEIKRIRYIGVTNNLDNRLIAHLDSSEKTPKAEWINSVQADGGSVDMVLLDAADSRKDALMREAAWIRFAESLGWELTNVARPAASSLSLVDTSATNPDDYHMRLISAVYQGRQEAMALGYEIRNDILNIVEELQMLNKSQSASVSPGLLPLRQSSIVAAFRHCLVGAISCGAIGVIDTVERQMVVDLSLLTAISLIIVAIMFIYPTYLVAKMVYAWLMAKGDPIGFAFGRDNVSRVQQ